MSRPLPYNESVLLSRLAQDDAEAFSTLFLHHYDSIYTAASNLLKDKAAAEDVCQQVFVTLWEKRHQVGRIESLSSYLFVCARNQIIARFKKQTILQNYQRHQLRQPPTGAPDPEHLLIGRQQTSLVQQAIRLLPPKQQQAFRLSRDQGLAHKDISRIMGISVPTVKEHISKSLAFIRKFLSQYQAHLLPLAMAWLLQ
jgi:RNA polymerase sigma-70 factor (ECF subfamily)